MGCAVPPALILSALCSRQSVPLFKSPYRLKCLFRKIPESQSSTLLQGEGWVSDTCLLPFLLQATYFLLYPKLPHTLTPTPTILPPADDGSAWGCCVCCSTPESKGFCWTPGCISQTINNVTGGVSMTGMFIGMFIVLVTSPRWCRARLAGLHISNAVHLH